MKTFNDLLATVKVTEVELIDSVCDCCPPTRYRQWLAKDADGNFSYGHSEENAVDEYKRMHGWLTVLTYDRWGNPAVWKDYHNPKESHGAYAWGETCHDDYKRVPMEEEAIKQWQAKWDEQVAIYEGSEE